MVTVRSIDLARLHAPYLDDLHAAALRVLSSGQYILGEEVRQFEHELAASSGYSYAVGVSSGSDALVASLMAVGVRAGREVITSPFTFISTAEAILRIGATPVFVDVDPRTLNLCPARAQRAQTELTDAYLPVDIFGAPASVPSTGIPVVIDGAQSAGAAPQAGGVCKTLSFFPAKNLGGFGDGGAVLTDSEVLARDLRAVRNHGSYDKLSHHMVGGNFRLDPMQAAMLRVKLPWMHRWTVARREIATLYRASIASCGIGEVRVPAMDARSVWNQFTIRAQRRDELREYMAKSGVQSAVYYPVPLHKQPALVGRCRIDGALEHAERACTEVLSLPIHPHVSAGDVAHVVETIAAFYG